MGGETKTVKKINIFKAMEAWSSINKKLIQKERNHINNISCKLFLLISDLYDSTHFLDSEYNQEQVKKYAKKLKDLISEIPYLER